MRKILKSVLSGVAVIAVATFSGCNDNDANGGTEVRQGDIVDFAMSKTPSSRTVYDDQNIFQINWEDNDNIKIYCNKSFEGISDASYKVTPTESDDPNISGNKLYNYGTISASGDAQLCWADNNEHKFIGVYPNDNSGISVDAESGIVTFPINHNQICESVKVKENSYYSAKYSDYTYYAKPDMKNAYLAAYNALTPEQAAQNDGHVFMDFKPVMTALEVVVKGKEQNTTPVQVTGISVRCVLPTNINESFRWNVAEASLADDVTGSNIENIFVDIRTTDGVNAVTLQSNESVVFTVFLPPFSVNAEYPIKIRVHATGNTEVTTKDITDDILSSNKRRITCPQIPSISGNNWITPLDGNIYVSQMSIPGSHDAATGEEMVTGIGRLFAVTQEQTLNTQWDLGVRAFDLRPAICYSSSENIDELWIYHGATRVSISWATAMNNIKAKLTDNPGEFAIVLFRHENESSSDKNNSDTDFNTYMTNYINQNQKWIVDWKPDLTIDEARGKIILISRFEGSWKYGCFTGWSHSKEGTETTLKNVDGSKSATMYVQDYYNASSTDDKWYAINKYMNISRTFHTDADKVNCWMINHCSGYVRISLSSTYRRNAAAQNPNLINKLTSADWQGSCGIMLFDYAGAATSGSVNVKGDLALQAIIDNNYKYRMKRKGE